MEVQKYGHGKEQNDYKRQNRRTMLAWNLFALELWHEQFFRVGGE